jgi:D-alanyl-lipoteichoic acid acyltransferase DltB (MBOAT superfamily)
VNYLAGLAIEALRPAAGGRNHGRLVFGLAVAADLGLLLVWKYTGFFVHTTDGIASALGHPLALTPPAWALPLGISFWTLQQVGYLLDVHHGRVAACRSPLTFALFSSFFPQLQAGPIPRSELLDLLAEPRAFDLEALRTGAFRFFRGFVGRFLVAAVLGNLLVDPAFAAAGQVSTARHWLALLGYAGQVFCDFAGYSEMAIGAGLVLGVRLPENFEAPYLASNLLQLWRRWHMSFTNWLFDYVYSPLMTGQSWLRGRLDVGFILTFLVSGLWHGAAWTFIVWGGLQGVGLVVHRRFDEAYRSLCRRDRTWVVRRRSRAFVVASWAVTQAFFLLTLVPFRARSFDAAAAFAHGLLRGGTAASPALSHTDQLNLLICAGLFVLHHALRGRRLELPAPVRGIAYGLVVVYLFLFMPVASGTFIYAQY